MRPVLATSLVALLAALLVVVVAVLAVACADSSEPSASTASRPNEAPSPRSSATQEASPSSPTSQTAAERPHSQASPPSQQQAPLAGVQTAVRASCRSTASGSEISVTYSVSVQGQGKLTRVMLLDNGQVVDDSGAISESSFSRQKTLSVASGSQHSFSVAYEPEAQAASSARSSVTC